ncbi:MAG: hypothetical protein EU533_01620 [Promethearchaeota archaeon]|nr:MAG: hypothetical protein EU533_01620 [Candidatus Lokiarchaeota archaeon]
MKLLDEIGTCPICEFSLMMYKTNNYKRFVKCDSCGVSYPLPKRGKISNSALTCPKSNFPVLIVTQPNRKSFFWADQPCFTCIKFEKCEVVELLISEFTALGVNGY